MQDRFANFQPSLLGPALSAFTIAPSDTDDFPEATRGLYIGQGGDLSVVMLSGDQVLFKSVGNGAVLPIRARRIRLTGTTATHVVGLV